jgi:hypothetical protein
MKLAWLWLLYFLFVPSSFAQLTARNPVDELKDQVTKALIDAKVPFTPDQEKQLALLIEEERQAAENLFGVTWDFSNGPPQGEQRDQALAGIQWMYDELKKKLPSYMTDVQRAAWEKYESGGGTAAPSTEASETGENRGAQARIQQIRVTNNAFNVESAQANSSRGPQSGGAKTEVIERGGVGAFHGNFASTFQDEKFNARNPFAINKPPYYERTIDGNISGPIIRDRFSMNLTVSDNKKNNVGTVKAETPTGPFSLGVTRPTLNRSYDVKGILQLADAHSLNMGFQYATSDSKNENVGDFGLPERASRTQTKNYMVDLREISVLSERTVHDVRFIWQKDHSETNPFSNAPAIIVKDAFTGGGAQNKNRSDGNQYDLSNLIYFAGEMLTMRSGFQAMHRRKRSISEENFFGEWTFSDLASYHAGKPLKYRITCCDPLSRLSQTQVALFSQNDFKLSRTFTLMLGARYQIQTNIHDRNQVDPRIGFAYALGNSTVIRGGGGVFSQWVSFGQLETVSRVDGKRIYEIQIDNPGYPDPFASGSVRPRSRRQMAPNTKMAIYPVFQIGVEQSLPNNLFVTVAWDRVRAIKPIRTRDVNAPLPETGIRPNPDEGQVFQYQSSGTSTTHHLKASLRQRFSIFVATANYTFMHFMTDQEDRRGGDIYLPVDNYNLWKEWGRAVDPRHDFSSSINARLPLDVYLTTIIRARSGGFYTITTGRDDNKDGFSNDRPPGVSKNSEVGPSYFDLGFNFSKAFELSRRGAAQAGSGAAAGPQMNVFANVNNALNMQHPGLPSGVMTSPFFGRSYNATAPRTIEVGMRFQF